MESKNKTLKKAGKYQMSIRIGGYISQEEVKQTGIDVPEWDMATEFPQKLLLNDAFVKKIKECVFQAIMDGYTTVVYNFVRHGDNKLTANDEC